jgi:hypothetical protein
MRWAGYVVRMVEMRMLTKSRLEILKGRDYSEDLGVDGRLILNWTLRNRIVGCELDSSGSG